MAKKREPISKSIRMEVFKRDSFKCQYCGRSAPEAILEIDHIKPVSKGGDNSILNLITSCRDCNRGKGKRELSDDTAVRKQKAQLDEINERREQIEMMVQWRNEMESMMDMQINAIENYFKRMYGEFYYFNEPRRKHIRKLIMQFNFENVYDAAQIAGLQYDSMSDAFSRLGGICYNRSKGVNAWERE